MHFADRFFAASEAKGAPVCVGVDPVFEKLPLGLRGDDPVDAIETFCMNVIDAVADHVPAVKPQIACFERYGSDGYAVYECVVNAARQAGLVVIGDAKRGDIGTSSAHYAAGMIAGSDYAVGCDSLTVNSYLGMDGIEPFVVEAAKHDAGLFALVRTSNPGGDALQSLQLADGRSVAEAVADQVAELGDAYLGESGYSLLGAVVGATKPADAVSLRKRMPRQLFLVPGFGAQGGSAEDVRACFNEDGRGAIITASRSVNYAFDPTDDNWPASIAAAAVDLRDQIAGILR